VAQELSVESLEMSVEALELVKELEQAVAAETAALETELLAHLRSAYIFLS
jgi:hypothetical protein